jgi:hypothetical protein
LLQMSLSAGDRYRKEPRVGLDRPVTGPATRPINQPIIVGGIALRSADEDGVVVGSTAKVSVSGRTDHIACHSVVPKLTT